MSDTKISALVAAVAAALANEIPINEAGTSKKLTVQQIADLFGETLRNQSTADQTPTAATLTYLTGSMITVPAAKLRIGTVLKWKLYLTKTAAGTAASTFDVRVGTAGSTADTARLSFTTDIGTAVIDIGYIEIVVVCRGPLSASGVMVGTFTMTHDLAITGFGTKAVRVQNVVSGTFDVTTAGLKIGLTVTTGAAQAWTFKQISAEAKNL